MKFEFDTRGIQFWWLKFIHLKVPRFIRWLQTIYFELIDFVDRSPKSKKNENIRDWLKRVPSKYSERYAEYLYDQMRSYYLEIKKRAVIYNYKKNE